MGIEAEAGRNRGHLNVETSRPGRDFRLEVEAGRRKGQGADGAGVTEMAGLLSINHDPR